MTTKNLNYGRRKAAFFGLAALVLSLGLILGACDHGLHSHDEAAVGADYSSGRKTIKVKFEVKNGGDLLLGSEGIISTQDDTYLVRDHDAFANDFTITITIPKSDNYVNLRWKCVSTSDDPTYLKGKVGVSNQGGVTYKPVIDYNGPNNLSTQNIYDKEVTQYDPPLVNDWHDAFNRSIPDE